MSLGSRDFGSEVLDFGVWSILADFGSRFTQFLAGFGQFSAQFWSVFAKRSSLKAKIGPVVLGFRRVSFGVSFGSFWLHFSAVLGFSANRQISEISEIDQNRNLGNRF